MRILVTGGAGFIGSNIVRRLVALGHEVTAADTFLSADWRELASIDPDSRATPLDVLTLEHRLDFEPIRSAIQRHGPFEAIFHQASLTGVIARDGSASAGDDIHGFMRNNVEQFRLLLDLALETHARVIWASSCSVYGKQPPPHHEALPHDPQNIYAFTKVQKERLARRYAQKLTHPIVALRYSNVYGPGESHKGKLSSMILQLARQMLAGKRPRIFTAGEQRRDFVYIDDVVDANLRALEATSPGIYNCGAGTSWSFNEVVRQLNLTLNTRLEPDYFDNPYGFTQDHTETDMSLIRNHLGHVPRFDLAAGISAYHASGALR